MGALAGVLVLFGSLVTATAAPVVAWGYNRHGETEVPADLYSVIAITAGYSHSAALLADGTVRLWGVPSREDEEEEDPPDDKPPPGSDLPPLPGDWTNIVEVTSGHNFLLVRDAQGRVHYWGGQSSEPNRVPGDLGPVQTIAAGLEHSIALKVDGTLREWGNLNPFRPSIPEDRVADTIAIAGGSDYSLFLESDGTVMSWQYEYFGPVMAPEKLGDVAAIAAGFNHGIALRTDGTLRTWGMKWTESAVIPEELTDVVAIAAGDAFGLALLADGTVQAWGMIYDGWGPLIPMTVPEGLSNVVAIAAGAHHALALVGEGPPRVMSPSINRTIPQWTTTTFYASAIGELPLFYQWLHNHQPLPNATNAYLLVNNVQPWQAGEYSVRVSNPLGSTQSEITRLELLPVLMSVEPDEIAVGFGGSATFTATVTSDAPVSYQWLFEGSEMEGFNQSTLTLDDLQFANAGAYSLLVSNAFGGVIESTACHLHVIPVLGWGAGDHELIPVAATLTNAISLGAGHDFFLALKADGTLAGWGTYAPSGRPIPFEVPSGLSGVQSFDGYGDVAAAVTTNGTINIWGDPAPGQSPAPESLTNAAAVAVGLRHILALKSDTSVVAWGDNTYGQIQVPLHLTNVVAVAAGTWHSLALRADGTVVGWGAHGLGPALVPAELSHVVAIACGDAFSLALKNDGSVVAWGQQLDLPAFVPENVKDAIAVHAGYVLGVALRSDGVVVAWGDPRFGQVGSSSTPPYVTAVAAGGVNAASLVGVGEPRLVGTMLDRTGSLGESVHFRAEATGEWPLQYQWYFGGQELPTQTNAVLSLHGITFEYAGSYVVTVRNRLGNVSSPGVRLSVVPMLITEQPRSHSVARGGMAELRIAVQATHPVSYAWFFDGEPLPGATNRILTFPNLDYRHHGWYRVVATGPFATFESEALLAVVPIIGWGSTEHGQLAIPLYLTNAVAIAAGAGHSLALTPAKRVIAWGDNSARQAEPPAGLSGVTAIAAGDYHSVALLIDGSLAAWGANDSGQIEVPLGATNIVTVAAGAAHTLALTRGGNVLAWGLNDQDQANPPAELSGVVSVTAGRAHSLALTSEGRVVAWGDNRFGQTAVPSHATNVVAIAAGDGHSLALQSGGSVLGWGWNVYGQSSPSPSIAHSLTTVVAIASGENRNLAIRQGGSVIAWGRNHPRGVTTLPSELQYAVAIAAGPTHNLALIDRVPPVSRVLITEPVLTPTHMRVVLNNPPAGLFLLESRDPTSDVGWRFVRLIRNPVEELLLEHSAPVTSALLYRLSNW